jgi:hypothetical protein
LGARARLGVGGRLSLLLRLGGGAVLTKGRQNFDQSHPERILLPWKLESAQPRLILERGTPREQRRTSTRMARRRGPALALLIALLACAGARAGAEHLALSVNDAAVIIGCAAPSAPLRLAAAAAANRSRLLPLSRRVVASPGGCVTVTAALEMLQDEDGQTLQPLEVEDCLGATRAAAFALALPSAPLLATLTAARGGSPLRWRRRVAVPPGGGVLEVLIDATTASKEAAAEDAPAPTQRADPRSCAGEPAPAQPPPLRLERAAPAASLPLVAAAAFAGGGALGGALALALARRSARRRRHAMPAAACSPIAPWQELTRRVSVGVGAAGGWCRREAGRLQRRAMSGRLAHAAGAGAAAPCRTPQGTPQGGEPATPRDAVVTPLGKND